MSNKKHAARLLTEEQHNFLTKITPGRYTKDIAKMMNNKFDLSLTIRQIRTYMKNHKLKNGVDTSFKKGHIPANKNTKGMFNVGGNKTSFKKGQIPCNYKPVGTERIDRDGYTLIKVRDEGQRKTRWVAKHKVVWEKVNGPIPPNYVVIFLDNDKQNFDLENLQLVTRTQNLQMNRNGWRYKNPEATKVGANLALIKDKIAKRKKPTTLADEVSK